MQREFVRNIAILLGINLLIKPFYIFGIDRSVQNHVGTEAWGYYATLLSFCYLFQMVNDFGIQNFNSRHISQHRQLLRKHFPPLLLIKTGFGLAFLVLVHLAGLFAGYAPGWLFFVIAFNLVLSSALLFLRSNVAGLGLYRHDSLLSALDKALMILLVGAALLVPAWRAQLTTLHFAVAQTASLLLAAAAALWVLRGHISLGPFHVKKAFALMALRQMAPYALVGFLMVLYTRIDMVMIEKLLPDGRHQAGIYAAGFRLLDAANNLGFLMAGLLLPMYARMLKTGESVRPVTLTAVRTIFPVAVIACVALAFFGPEIMATLHAPQADAYWGRVAGVVFGGYLAISLMYIFGTLLTAAGQLRAMNSVFAIGVAINFALNLWLIPRHGALGAAWSSFFTQSAVTIGLIFLCVKKLNAGIPSIWWWRIAGYAAITAAMAAASKAWIHDPLSSLLTFTMAATAWTFAAGIIDLRKLGQLAGRNTH